MQSGGGRRVSFTFDDDTEFGGHHMGDATTYQSALIAALDDDVISEDEWAMLDHLRRIIGLQKISTPSSRSPFGR